MVRRNRVPESVSMETPMARKAGEERRHRVAQETAERQRNEENRVRPVLRAPTAQEYAARLRANEGSIRPRDNTYGRSDVDRRLGDAAMMALTAAAGASVPSEVQSGHNPTLDGYSGPRIVINPQVFNDKRDALCVAFNEAFRIVMEDNAFEPVSEPTEKQRRFFADTAYADNEMQLRRTILARIATLDTSVSDPTDEQLQETAEMLEMVMEVGAPQNEWEQRCVKRLLDIVSASLNVTKNPQEPH